MGKANRRKNWLGLPLLGDPERPIHQSDLNAYRRCPRQYAFSRVREATDELPQKTTALIALKGRVYHRLMEDYLTHNFEDWDTDEVETGYRSTFEFYIKEDFPADLTDKEQAWLEKESATAGRIMRGFHERSVLGDMGIELAATEAKFNFRWGPYYRHKMHFAGRLDALWYVPGLDGYILRDFKSGTRLPGRLEWNHQLGVYSMAVEIGAIEGVPPKPVLSRGIIRLQDYDVYKQGGKNGAAGDYKGPGVYTADPAITPAMVMEHEVYPLVLEIRERERTGRFNGGTKDRNDCSWCSPRGACEAVLDVRKPEETFLEELRRDIG